MPKRQRNVFPTHILLLLKDIWEQNYDSADFENEKN